MTNEELQIRDLAWERAKQLPVKGWREFLSSFESIYTELLYDHWKKLNDTKVPTNPYHYENFDAYWKIIVPHLWNIKEWDNELIKEWVQATFEDARRRTV